MSSHGCHCRCRRCRHRHHRRRFLHLSTSRDRRRCFFRGGKRTASYLPRRLVLVSLGSATDWNGLGRHSRRRQSPRALVRHAIYVSLPRQIGIVNIGRINAIAQSFAINLARHRRYDCSPVIIRPSFLRRFCQPPESRENAQREMTRRLTWHKSQRYYY